MHCLWKFLRGFPSAWLEVRSRFLCHQLGWNRPLCSSGVPQSRGIRVWEKGSQSSSGQITAQAGIVETPGTDSKRVGEKPHSPLEWPRLCFDLAPLQFCLILCCPPSPSAQSPHSRQAITLSGPGFFSSQRPCKTSTSLPPPPILPHQSGLLSRQQALCFPGKLCLGHGSISLPSFSQLASAQIFLNTLKAENFLP